MTKPAKLIITIDGPAASGKSAVSKLLAQKLDAAFLDTGAMYRAVTLAAMKSSVDLTDSQKLLTILQNSDFQFTIADGMMKVTIDGDDVTEQIRQPQVTAKVKYVASIEKLRSELVKMQRCFAGKYAKIVTEGRDQGTVAFPDADFKFFLTADITERTRRRQAQLTADGRDIPVEQIRQDIAKRDASDENRDVGPLTPAADAIIVDTTKLSLDEVVEKLFLCVTGK